ncbi:hypothetical protein [Chroococcus sp. FPU101]|uniref:hypothetical protein n=1 Tax=Chroococcus sp. FPU101 TaxID=1974212 RepID=UPI001A8C8E66|nr:hypothetical protein [Chroococcus sp. FPU101]GFE70042.1 hypothetical protein CFPU101_26520 [Chroococcus sp. FPU101]
MNPQILNYKQQILENIQTLEKLCTEYLAIAENIPEDKLIVYSLGDQPIYDAVFLSVGESFYSEMRRIV